MSDILVLSASPSTTSKTERVAEHVTRRLTSVGNTANHVRLRELPAEPLLAADTTHPAVAEVTNSLEAASGVVLATPTYKAAYSGLLKVFLDLLPQFGLAGKAVLPLATGGSIAHVLSLDYALRPVVHSLGPRHVVQSFFLLNEHLTVDGDTLDVHEDSAGALQDVLEQFEKALAGIPHATVLGRTA